MLQEAGGGSVNSRQWCYRRLEEVVLTPGNGATGGWRRWWGMMLEEARDDVRSLYEDVDDATDVVKLQEAEVGVA